MDNYSATERNVDIVFCIDGTGSMDGCIENVKNHATRFRADFVKALTEMGSDVASLRVKVIVFRDYESEGANAILESSFFELTDGLDEPEFAAYMAGVQPEGGGDIPENGLEALYRAMLSDFTCEPKDRQVIVLFTDADALPLGARKDAPGYPADMVDDKKFFETWMCSRQDISLSLKNKNKRMVLFAPAGTKYEEISASFERCYHTAVNRANGLKELDFKEIIKIIAASM